MINKLINFVQKALKLPKTVALVQVGNSREGTKKLKRQRAFLEFFNIKVEWYYFEANISSCDLVFELEVLKPYFDKIITYPRDAVQKRQQEEYSVALQEWREEASRLMAQEKERRDRWN